MPTHNPRINVTLEPKLNRQINAIATRESKSASSIIKELIIEAIERREDIYLSKLAHKRDNKNQKMISHEDAWK